MPKSKIHIKRRMNKKQNIQIIESKTMKVRLENKLGKSILVEGAMEVPRGRLTVPKIVRSVVHSKMKGA